MPFFIELGLEMLVSGELHNGQVVEQARMHFKMFEEVQRVK